MDGKIATILGKKEFTNDKNEVFYIVEHSLDDNAIFASKEMYEILRIFGTGLVVTKKYQKDGEWKTTRSILPITLG